MTDTYWRRADIPGRPVIGFAQLLFGHEYSVRRIDSGPQTGYWTAFNSETNADPRHQSWRLYGPFNTPQIAAATGQTLAKEAAQ